MVKCALDQRNQAINCACNDRQPKFGAPASTNVTVAFCMCNHVRHGSSCGRPCLTFLVWRQVSETFCSLPQPLNGLLGLLMGMPACLRRLVAGHLWSSKFPEIVCPEGIVCTFFSLLTHLH